MAQIIWTAQIEGEKIQNPNLFFPPPTQPLLSSLLTPPHFFHLPPHHHSSIIVARREPSHRDRLFLKAMQSNSAGVFRAPAPAALEGGDEEAEILYMRSTFERVMGSPDSESFHLINPQGSPDQELSLFLLRSR